MFNKATIKNIQSLQQKKIRDELGLFVAEGPKVVEEFLQTQAFPCINIYALNEWVNKKDKALYNLYADKIVIIEDFELLKIAAYSTPNKVVGVFQKKVVSNKIDVKNKITLVLDDIQDPGNLGAIIRTADWFGIESIICSSNTVDMYNAKVVQSTMASLARVNILYTDLIGWLDENKKIKKYAATLDGPPLTSSNKTKEAIIIIGNESRGVQPEILKLVDHKITIPKKGGAESLNASVATAIILYSFTNF